MTHTPIWLFDLDNTLHDAGRHIFPRINQAMTAYLSEALSISTDEACALRLHYWRQYGATLRGLQKHHGTNPRHFLQATHQFADLASLIVFEPPVVRHLRKLPGRKYIFSNAPKNYVQAILRLTGLDRVIDGSFAVEDLGFHPKPQRRAYHAVLRQIKAPAHHCIFVEDTADNLRPAKQMGMRTIWVAPAQKKPLWVDRRVTTVLAIRHP
jgi:putative hydrolase of the HAD superfamily